MMGTVKSNRLHLKLNTCFVLCLKLNKSANFILYFSESVLRVAQNSICYCHRNWCSVCIPKKQLRESVEINVRQCTKYVKSDPCVLPCLIFTSRSPSIVDAHTPVHLFISLAHVPLCTT